MTRARDCKPPRFAAAIAILLACPMLGCAGSEVAEMKRQIDQQKAQIEAQRREIDQMRAQQQQQAASYRLPPPGSCDDAVMRRALAHGDDQYAGGQYAIALGYYQDAEKACPGRPQPELSLARVYEAMGNRAEARRHYQRALDAAPAGTSVADQARRGVNRLNSGL